MAAQHDNDVMSHMNEAPNPPLAAFSVCAEPVHMQSGRTLISQHRCNSCHNLDLTGRENIPHIANRREDFLAKALREYCDNIRHGYGVMASVLVRR